MRLQIAMIMGAALMFGCKDNGKEQLWFFTASPASEPVANLSVSHNFTDGSVPDDFDSADWIIADDQLTSDAMFTGQLVEIEGDEAHGALLIIGGEVFPGVEDAEGGWIFSWEGFDNNQSVESHESGYSFTTRFDGTVSTTITWSIDKKTKIASGEIVTSSDDTTAWTESDMFDAAVVGIYPQIPSWAYLIDDMGYPIENAPGVSNCSTEPCSLELISTSAQNMTFTAVQTDYSDEDVYGSVQDAGQPFGN